MENKRRTGDHGELRACRFLEEQGLTVEVRNFRCKTGEIDIIARHGNTIVFVEVKYRSAVGSGQPAEAVNYGKQRIISRVADYYRMKYGLGEELSYRFDVVGILGDEITWYQNAFEYIN